MDYLETTGNEVLALLAEQGTDNNTAEDIEVAFAEFLQAVSYSESLTETHRYYSGIPYRLWDERVTSFLITYSLYAKKFELVHRMIVTVSKNDHNKKALNHFNEYFERSGIYDELVSGFYHPKTRVRLTGGYLYARLFIGDSYREENSFVLLRDKSYQSYGYLKSGTIDTLKYAPEIAVDGIETNMFETWFPIQKTVASAMGKTIISTRGAGGLIQPEDALLMEKQMLPGDIMLQRRNWHVSNVGIPGFWTHSAIYTGDLETLDTFFASEFPYDGFESMSQLMQSQTPVAYTSYSARNESGYNPSVIEAIEPGVVAQSIVKSADADFVVVLRPNLSKRDIFLALIKAFSNAGKPYDFNFDFDTRDALVCSELVYDAYFERLPEKVGLQMDTSLVSGRKIVSPFDIAKKYVDERASADRELTFVYFLRSDEKTKDVQSATEEDFVQSLEWSKFSFLQESLSE
jgi:hypothetical protein